MNKPRVVEAGLFAARSGSDARSSSTRTARSYRATCSGYLNPLRPGHQPGRSARDQREASQGNRERGSPRPGRGALVAALAHRAQQERALGSESPAHLARPRRWPQRQRPRLAEAEPSRPATGARPPRSAGIRPGSSTSGKASALATRTPPNSNTGEIRVETADRANGYWTTRSESDPALNARTAGVYLRADPSGLRVLDSGTEEGRAELLAQRLREWQAAANAF